jgi:ubiquinol-cytochrome c reductase cytochrome b subunit
MGGQTTDSGRFTDSAGRMLSSLMPRIGFSCLLICLASGVVLTFYYRPMGNVFQNVEEISTVVPYGWFFRRLHDAAGQAFVILMLLHTLDHLVRRRYRLFPFRDWAVLILSLSLCFFTLFTGFILKADQEGTFAGRIFMNLLLAVPAVGRRLAALFIVQGDDLYFLPYLHHCFFLPTLILCLLRTHIRAWLPDRGILIRSFIGLLLYACLVRPGVDIPPDALVSAVRGPWFFLGMQILLKHLPPFEAGIGLPLAFLGFLLALPLPARAGRDTAGASREPRFPDVFLYALVLAGLLGYTGLTLWAAIWGP